jgi:hypothetical protein
MKLTWVVVPGGISAERVSGFAHLTSKLPTSLRVMGEHAYNSYWQDPQGRFDHKDFWNSRVILEHRCGLNASA